MRKERKKYWNLPPASGLALTRDQSFRGNASLAQQVSNVTGETDRSDDANSFVFRLSECDQLVQLFESGIRVEVEPASRRAARAYMTPAL